MLPHPRAHSWPGAASRRCAALAALALATLLAGCPAPNSVVRPTVDAGAGLARAERLARGGDAAGSARAYEDAATRAQGATRADALAAAIRQWLAARSAPDAERVLVTLSAEFPVDARGAAGVERALLASEVALATGQPERALSTLRALGEPPPAGSESAVLLARGRASFAAGRLLDGVRAYVARDRLLAGAEIERNRALLWESLRAAAARGADARVPKGTDALAAGWLELAGIATQGQRNPQTLKPQLDAWLTRHASHPANGPIVSSLLTQVDTPLELPAQVALVLPLSGRAQAAGEAIRDGFMAAYFQQGAASRPRVRVYDASADAAEAYRRAIADGAAFIVGPLTKEDVQSVARSADASVGTLALNVLPDGEPVPPRFWQFALAPEDEARQVGERLLAEGRRVGVAIVPAGEWGARVLAALGTALANGGGAVVGSRTYPPNTNDYSAQITEVLGFESSMRRRRQLESLLGSSLEFTPRRRDDLQFVFVAGQPVQGRLIRPQLKFHYAGDLPVYSTSDVYDPNPAANEDLDGVMFPDAPWMIAQDSTVGALRDSLTQLWPQSVRRRGRLYAMGFDAYRLVGALHGGRGLEGDPIPGMTGRLSIDAGGRVRRGLDWAAIGSDGQPQPLPALVVPTASATP